MGTQRGVGSPGPFTGDQERRESDFLTLTFDLLFNIKQLQELEYHICLQNLNSSSISLGNVSSINEALKLFLYL